MERKKVYNPEMLTADTAGAHNSILTVAVRILLAIFPKAAVLAAFMLSGFLAYIAEAQVFFNLQEACKERPNTLALHCAAFSGDIAEVKRLLGHGNEWTANKKESGLHSSVPLHWAAQGGRTDVIKELIKADADLNVKNSHKYTPLHFAAKAGSAEAVNILIAAGANVMATSDIGTTPLHSAVASDTDNADILTALIASGANVRATNNTGETPLHRAVSGESMKAVIALIAAGANVYRKDNTGRTPLHNAAFRHNKNLISVLIAAGANVNSKDKYGYTPLHHVAIGGNEVTGKETNAINALIAAGANVNPSNNNASPLHAAALNGNTEIILTLIKAGARINTPDAGGRTPIDWAEDEHGKDSTIAIFLREAAKRQASKAEQEAQKLLERLEQD